MSRNVFDLILELRSETSVMKHTFRQERVPQRPDIIQYVHDVDECLLCALINVADCAISQVNIFHDDSSIALVGAVRAFGLHALARKP